MCSGFSNPRSIQRRHHGERENERTDILPSYRLTYKSENELFLLMDIFLFKLTLFAFIRNSLILKHMPFGLHIVHLKILSFFTIPHVI